MEIILVGCQCGDEGKGKFTDVFSRGAAAVVRYQGGPHTGHTVVADDRIYRFIQLPTGINRGAKGILGNGCVIDPAALAHEIEEFGGLAPEQLLISEIAHVIMPYHRLQDQAMERWRGDTLATSAATGFRTGAGQLGSTKRGVGPCREDKIARLGLRMIDLLDEPTLRERLARILPLKLALLRRVFDMSPEDLAAEDLDLDRLVTRYHALGQRFAPHLGDVSAALAAARRRGDYLVYEGAQSVALDIEHGTYPYCSSGYSAAGGVTVGTGSPPGTPFTVIGVAKAYMTQVGGGPLPTEVTGALADHLVQRGQEIGTVTGRRRRVGWFDMPFLRRAIQVDGLHGLCLTSLDVLAGLPEVQVATHYRLDGRDIDTYPVSLSQAARIEPVMRTFPGWPDGDWDAIATAGYHALPANARRFLEYLRDSLDTPLAAIGVGRRRDQTIVLDVPSPPRQEDPIVPAGRSAVPAGPSAVPAGRSAARPQQIASVQSASR